MSPDMTGTTGAAIGMTAGSCRVVIQVIEYVLLGRGGVVDAP
jgi:hypothetical protein